MRIQPWRGPGPGRPDVPLPPGRMAAVRDGRPLKRWTWVGACSEGVRLCAASARVGPARVSWWAVWDGERLTEHTTRRARTSVEFVPSEGTKSTLAVRV